jgi:ketosteroid isomerase-like protein
MKGRPSGLHFLAVAVLLAALSCSQSETIEEESVAAVDEAAMKDSLMQADRDFAVATAERGVDGWLSYFAPNGAMIVAGMGEVEGHDAIRELMGSFLSDSGPRLLWEPIHAQVGVGSDLGYTVGSSRREARDSANTLLGTGTYLSIWRRQADGTWKVERDIGTYTPVEEEE